MEEALSALLLGHGPLTGLVGDRVHWRRQSGLVGVPYVILQTISDPRQYHTKGETALRTTRVQIDSWADTLGAAKAVEAVLSDLLSGFQGNSGGVRFQGVFLDGSRDLEGKSIDGAPALICRSADFNFNWNKES